MLLCQILYLKVLSPCLRPHNNAAAASSQDDGFIEYVRGIMERVESWCYKVGRFLNDFITRSEKEGAISSSKRVCVHCEGRGWNLPNRCLESDDNFSDFSY